ncbi:MAG: cytochrome c-type protein NapC [Acidobacteriota bacterium]|jgi:nitrate/TMAO reductase-like tetraheme cytochrome c subunit|nr:cytochrome c-type protein NapC [Acidobacteriota bacterium]
MAAFGEGFLAVAIVTAVTIALIALVVLRPSLLAARGGKILAFLAFLVLPVLVTATGLNLHMESSKSTAFCLSCHVMAPYGKSLYVDDKDHLPAAHFQNSRIPRDHACFTCHTTYTLFGDYKAKLTGLRHVYVNYIGTIPKTIKLYQPYNNRECLHCHAGARSFEDDDVHKGVREDLMANKTSCLECHGTVHDVAKVDQLPAWHGGKP